MQSFSAHITAYLCISSTLLLEFISCSKKIFFSLYRSADIVKNIYILLQAIRKPACNHKIFQYNENKFKEKGKKKREESKHFPRECSSQDGLLFFHLSSLFAPKLTPTHTSQPNPSRICFTRSSKNTFCSMICVLGAPPRAIYFYLHFYNIPILPSIAQKHLAPENHNLVSPS